MNKKQIYLLLLTLTIISLSIPFAHATESITYDGAASHNSAFQMAAVPPSATSTWSNLGTAFTATTTGYLSRITVYGKHTGTPAGNLVCELAGVTGTVGTNATPNATVFDTATMAVTDTPTIWNTFTITFTSVYQIIAGQNYTVNLYSDNDGSGYNTTNCMWFYLYNGNSEAGNEFWYHESAYEGNANDFHTVVYVSDVSGATPAPTSYPVGSTDQLYTDLIAFFTPLFVMLIPALLLWYLGGRGKWALLIGLAIGTGLGYVFIANFPIWLVFLVAIGIIGMAYSDVSSGNGMT